MALSTLKDYTKDNSYLVCTFTGTYDDYGFKVFLLQLVNSGNKVVDKLRVISGSPAAQKRALCHPKSDFAGSGNPCPEGIYKIGRVIKMSIPEKGIGYTKIPIDVLPEFKVNNRSEILIHLDSNWEQFPGSLGCIVTYTKKDMDRIEQWCSQKNNPKTLVVNYNTGFLQSRNIKIDV